MVNSERFSYDSRPMTRREYCLGNGPIDARDSDSRRRVRCSTSGSRILVYHHQLLSSYNALPLIAEERPEGSPLPPMRSKARFGRYANSLEPSPINNSQLDVQLRLQAHSPTRPVMPLAQNSPAEISQVQPPPSHWSQRPELASNSCPVWPRV